MKIGIVSYPALWQRRGGLQIQIEKTSAALRQLGVELKVLDLSREKLNTCDIIHAFSVAHGMHIVIQEAKRQGVKVAISPILQPETNLGKFQRFRLLDRLASKFSSGELKTSYGQLSAGMSCADVIFALSTKEALVLAHGYQVSSEKIVIIPNGIDDLFFEDEAAAFPAHLKIPDGYVFISASISEYKNQLGVIEATKRPVVLAGDAPSKDYLKQCLDAGGSRVFYVGALDHTDPILKSLYVNAAVNVMVSRGEAGPLCTIESLASKVPAVVTERNGLMLQAKSPMLQYVNSKDSAALKAAIELGAQASHSDRISCREMVIDLRWSSVAKKMLPVYQSLLK